MSNTPTQQVPWVVMKSDENLIKHLCNETGLSPLVIRLLVNRGVETKTDVNRFLHPSLSNLHDPFLLPDMEIGANRLAKAIKSGERICVHGDYDVDGITSTALLVRTLRALKANVEYRIPHRRNDGYDIKSSTVAMAAKRGVGLIITCDCGINACESVEYAASLGIDTIITDHHEPGDELPKALAAINPKRFDSDYPFTELAGVGVAFKLAQGLVRLLGHNEESFRDKFLDLATIGTVADVVPLLNENRIIVKHGLTSIERSKKIGLQTILNATNAFSKPMSVYYLGYVLGPRINAVGRMADAATALELLLTLIMQRLLI